MVVVDFGCLVRGLVVLVDRAWSVQLLEMLDMRSSVVWLICIVGCSGILVFWLTAFCLELVEIARFSYICVIILCEVARSFLFIGGHLVEIPSHRRILIILTIKVCCVLQFVGLICVRVFLLHLLFVHLHIWLTLLCSGIEVKVLDSIFVELEADIWL